MCKTACSPISASNRSKSRVFHASTNDRTTALFASRSSSAELPMVVDMLASSVGCNWSADGCGRRQDRSRTFRRERASFVHDPRGGDRGGAGLARPRRRRAGARRAARALPAVVVRNRDRHAEKPRRRPRRRPGHVRHRPGAGGGPSRRLSGSGVAARGRAQRVPDADQAGTRASLRLRGASGHRARPRRGARGARAARLGVARARDAAPRRAADRPPPLLHPVRELRRHRTRHGRPGRHGAEPAQPGPDSPRGRARWHDRGHEDGPRCSPRRPARAVGGLLPRRARASGSGHLPGPVRRRRRRPRPLGALGRGRDLVGARTRGDRARRPRNRRRRARGQRRHRRGDRLRESGGVAGSLPSARNLRPPARSGSVPPSTDPLPRSNRRAPATPSPCRCSPTSSAPRRSAASRAPRCRSAPFA